MAKQSFRLCALEDIADGGAKGVTLGAGADRREIIVLRRGGAVFGYENRCPHQINLHSGDFARMQKS